VCAKTTKPFSREEKRVAIKLWRPRMLLKAIRDKVNMSTNPSQGGKKGDLRTWEGQIAIRDEVNMPGKPSPFQGRI
jgi:hypothetical protein